MARASAAKKIVITVAAVLLVASLAAGAFILTDYLRFKHGDRSHFFGTLSVYKQNQTLHFNDFDVWVTQVERRDYPATDLIHCSGLPHKPYNYVPPINLPGFIEPEKWQEDCYSLYPKAIMVTSTIGR